MLKAFDQHTGEEVKIGDTITNFRGEQGILESLDRARTTGKSGKVVVAIDEKHKRYNYDNVWGLEVRDVVSTKTRHDMVGDIDTALDGGPDDNYGPYMDEIVDACYAAAGNSWDLDQVDSETFWGIVERIMTRRPTFELEPEPVTGGALLNAMIANYVGFGEWQDRIAARAESYGRFDTLLHAVTVLHPTWTEDQATEWLAETCQDIRANNA